MNSTIYYDKYRNEWINEYIPDWVSSNLSKALLHYTPTGALKIFFNATGYYADSPASYSLIWKVIKEYDMYDSIAEYTESERNRWKTFNDFFTRILPTGSRPITDHDKSSLTSPADSRIMYVPGELLESYKHFITNRPGGKYIIWDHPSLNIIQIKSAYICRLAPCDNHRFTAASDSKIRAIYEFDGTYAPVHPKSVDDSAWFTNYQKVIEIEWLNTIYYYLIIGAAMVGSIILHDHVRPGNILKKGTELGYFKYGGSTIILLFGRLVAPEKCIFQNFETYFRKNDKIGTLLGTDNELG